MKDPGRCHSFPTGHGGPIIICLVLALALPLLQGCEETRKPDHVKVVVLEGDAYQRGFSHGEQLASRIRSLYTSLLPNSLLPYLNRERPDIASVLVEYQDDEEQAKSVNREKYDTEEDYQAAVDKKTANETIYEAYIRECKASRPENEHRDKCCFSYMMMLQSAQYMLDPVDNDGNPIEGAGIPADAQQEMQGIADGSGVPYEDILVLNTFLDTMLSFRAITFFIKLIQAPTILEASIPGVPVAEIKKPSEEEEEEVEEDGDEPDGDEESLDGDAIDGDTEDDEQEPEEILAAKLRGDEETENVPYEPSAYARWVEVPTDAEVHLLLEDLKLPIGVDKGDEPGVNPCTIRIQMNTTQFVVGGKQAGDKQCAVDEACRESDTCIQDDTSIQHRNAQETQAIRKTRTCTSSSNLPEDSRRRRWFPLSSRQETSTRSSTRRRSTPVSCGTNASCSPRRATASKLTRCPVSARKTVAANRRPSALPCAETPRRTAMCFTLITMPCWIPTPRTNTPRFSFTNPPREIPTSFLATQASPGGFSGMNTKGLVASFNNSDSLDNPMVGAFADKLLQATLLASGVPVGMMLREDPARIGHGAARSGLSCNGRQNLRMEHPTDRQGRNPARRGNGRQHQGRGQQRSLHLHAGYIRAGEPGPLRQGMEQHRRRRFTHGQPLREEPERPGHTDPHLQRPAPEILDKFLLPLPARSQPVGRGNQGPLRKHRRGASQRDPPRSSPCG